MPHTTTSWYQYSGPGVVSMPQRRISETRFGRKIKEDATPMLILAPMHPVMLVYDLDSTEGRSHCRKTHRLFARPRENGTQTVWILLLENAKRDGILVQFKELSSTMGGSLLQKSITLATRCASL